MQEATLDNPANDMPMVYFKWMLARDRGTRHGGSKSLIITYPNSRGVSYARTEHLGNHRQYATCQN